MANKVQKQLDREALSTATAERRLRDEELEADVFYAPPSSIFKKEKKPLPRLSLTRKLPSSLERPRWRGSSS